MARADSPNVVGMGWTSPEIKGADFDELWEALVFEAQHPGRFMEVSEVTVAHRPGFLARAMTVNATQKRVEEHIYALERKGEMIYRQLDGQTKRETGVERVIAVKEGPLRLEFFQRCAAAGVRTYWQLPARSVEQMIDKLAPYVARVAKEGREGTLVGLGVCSPEIEDASHEALWRAMVESIREPARFFPCSDVVVKDCGGVMHRTMTADGDTYSEHVHEDARSHEIICRRVTDGAETDAERVTALRSHPLEIELFQRSRSDGFRLHWSMPKADALGYLDALVQEAKRMDGPKPFTVGYGITSDPVRECSYDSLLVAIQTTIRHPWLAMEVDQSTCEVRDCHGFFERKMRLNATGEEVIERIVVNDEIGEVSYSKCNEDGQPGSIDRVIAIRMPLQLEIYERDISTGLRLNCSMPYVTARQVLDNIVQMAKGVEKPLPDTVGFGIASKPLTRMTQDALWKAMLASIRHPSKFCMGVDQVSVRDMDGYLQRSMRILEKPGTPTLTDNVRVLERAREITFRSVVDGQESQVERVFALQADPLRFEMFKRHSRDEMRLNWRAPCSVVTAVFEAVVSLVSGGFEDVGHFEKVFKWSKCAVLPGGELLFTPFNHPSILLFSPSAKTWDLVGSFEGDCKWSGCAALPNGKFVFVPYYSSIILIFDPCSRTWEEVPVDPSWLVPVDPAIKVHPKFSDCLALPDGTVLFVPYSHSSIVLFDPATKTWEEVGSFAGKDKWSGCKMLPDGKVVFIPFTDPSILIFDPHSKTWETVGCWDGGFKWSGSELLPDGRLLFAPLKHRSILFFDPVTRCWEEVGDFGEDRMKWNGCRRLLDGRVVFVPLDSPSVLVFDPRNKTSEEVAHGKKGRRMASDCTVLPDGRVVFVPGNCHEIVFFTPPLAPMG